MLVNPPNERAIRLLIGRGEVKFEVRIESTGPLLVTQSRLASGIDPALCDAILTDASPPRVGHDRVLVLETPREGVREDDPDGERVDAGALLDGRVRGPFQHCRNTLRCEIKTTFGHTVG